MIFLRKVSFWLAVLGLVSAGQLLIRLQASINQPIPAPPVVPPSKPFPHAIGASGLVEALRENTLVGAPVGGLVTAVEVDVWKEVKRGDPLFRLDDRDLQAALLLQKAQLDVAHSQLKRLEDQLSRLQAIDDPRAIPQEDLRNRESDVVVARAQVTSAQAAIDQTHALIDRLTVRAPIDGAVLQVNIRAGEYASPAAAVPPMVLGQVNEVQLRADVDEQLAPRVKPGKRAIGYIKGAPEDPIEMTFVRIEPFVVPKRSLTGASIERVDTRVLQVIYRFPSIPNRPVYVGQQMDLYIEE